MQKNRTAAKTNTITETQKRLHGREKLQYLWDYCKLPLLLLGIGIYAAVSFLSGRLTDTKPALYAALVNVAAGEEFCSMLEDGFPAWLKDSSAKDELQLYTGLYLTDDASDPWHEYTYASRMKILAAIDGEQLDVVLMNREAFDAFSQSGYLLDLEAFLSLEEPALFPEIRAFLEKNTVILEDNYAEHALDASVEYQAVTEEHAFGLNLSEAGRIRKAGFDDTLYLGILQNSPRTETAAAFIRYLFAAVHG